VAGSPALPELSGANYARTHAAYEAASDQRAGLQAWLPRERSGGLLVAATPPREPLCVLTDLLSPGTGHRLWCAEDVTAELESRGLELQSETMVAGLDLGDVHIDPPGVGELVLDFLVGARTSVMSVEVRKQVMAYLAEVELADSLGVVAHPIGITIARAP
jgi:hypothetical protein